MKSVSSQHHLRKQMDSLICSLMCYMYTYWAMCPWNSMRYRKLRSLCNLQNLYRLHKEQEEGEDTGLGKVGLEMCREIPAGYWDAAAIPVQWEIQETSAWLRSSGWGGGAVQWWLKAWDSQQEQGSRNIPQASSLVVYHEDPPDSSRDYTIYTAQRTGWTDRKTRSILGPTEKVLFLY